jgi:hypothetical protein
MSRKDFIPAARFRFLTPFYDRACSLIGLGAALRRFELGLLGPLPPGEALEVGCGTGELLLHLWPLRFDLFEEQPDNFRGRVPGLLRAAGFIFEEVGVYRSAIVAYQARPTASGDVGRL